jgi:predicted acetyltransferase
MELVALHEEALPQAINFAPETLGADRDWLSNYFADLVSDEKLFGLWDGDELITTGKCRPNENYPQYADVGMVVSTSHRRQGLATQILRHLIEIAEAKKLKPICSTEQNNIGAQHAITKAGFISYQQILDITF